jgi:hypothetical protein
MRASRLRRLLLSACIVPLVSSCAGDMPSAASPSDADAFEAAVAGATLRLSSGGGQMGMPGRPLQDPIIVRVLNASGAPVADAPVTFTPPEGSGVEPRQARTDARGYAQAVWTLGAVGPQTLRVSGPGTAVDVTATGRKGSGTVTSLIKTGGDGQAGAPGSALPSALQVRVVRDDGTPVYNATAPPRAARPPATRRCAGRWAPPPVPTRSPSRAKGWRRSSSG